jgi:pimeloyl-ACP methyl ester carboxylesterase
MFTLDSDPEVHRYVENQPVQNIVPNSQLTTIDKCGHAPMMEHPEKFNSIVEAFLK